MMATARYSHVDMLASQCARTGCSRVAPCISDRDAQRICAPHAAEEAKEDDRKV